MKRLAHTCAAVAVVLFAMTLAAWASTPKSAKKADHAPAKAASTSKDSHAPEGGKAAKAGDHGGGSGEHGEAKKPADDGGGLFSGRDNLVPLPTLIAPVLINDKLGAHLYLFLGALTEDSADAQTVKARLPYIQDAMVREVYLHRVVIGTPDEEPNTIALLARLKDAINAAVGEPLVKEIEVGRIDTAPY